MITDGIYLLPYLFLEFFCYTLAYTVIFKAKVKKSIWHWILSAVLIIAIHYSILYFGDTESAFGSSTLTMVIIPLLILEGKKIRYTMLYPVIALGTSLIGLSISFLIAAMIHSPEAEIITDKNYIIICQILQSIALLLAAGYQKKKKKELFEISLSWKQYILFYIVTICLFSILTPIQSLSGIYKQDNSINSAGVYASIGCVVLVILSLWHGMFVNREIALREQNDRNEEFIRLQKEHFRTLLEQDDNLRRFRHDYTAHMNFIREKCRNEDLEAIEAYMNHMAIEAASIYLENYTGNNDIDAILRPLIIYAKRQNIKVEINGTISRALSINEYDLCTIISNLLKNAIEACEKIKNDSERRIDIILESYHNQVLISVKNTIAQPPDLINRLFKSTKSDLKNHGIGIRNVEHAISKYNGMIEYQIEDNFFKVECLI